MELLQFSYFSRQAGGVTGVDVVDEMLEASRKNFKIAEEENDWFSSDFVNLVKGDALNLPVADESPEFETFFGTPHEWEFEEAAGLFDLPYAHVKDLEEFVMAYQEAVSTRRSCLIEVQTDRKQNVEQHQALAAMLDLPV